MQLALMEKKKMSLTVPDIMDKLKQMDEVTLLEILEINSEQLVDRFADVIEDKADLLEEDLE